jgi:hypothetical protein
MDILRHGKHSAVFAKKYAGECDNCGCRVRCDKSEVMWNRATLKESVVCPTCGESLTVHEGRTFPEDEERQQ